MVNIKRVYEPATSHDGLRILVDGIWPRGITRERARIADWRRELAPSASLRGWFRHDPSKWKRFRERYVAELRRPRQREALKLLARQSRHEPVTLVYSAADEDHNQAVVLRAVLNKLVESGAY